MWWGLRWRRSRLGLQPDFQGNLPRHRDDTARTRSRKHLNSPWSWHCRCLRGTAVNGMHCLGRRTVFAEDRLLGPSSEVEQLRVKCESRRHSPCDGGARRGCCSRSAGVAQHDAPLMPCLALRSFNPRLCLRVQRQMCRCALEMTSMQQAARKRHP